MHWLEQRWYQTKPALLWLRPIEALYKKISQWRRSYYSQRQKSQALPIIIVGNISVGGTGKTPFTLWLIKSLIEAGYKPGIISRGYGSKAPYYPFLVSPDSLALEAGDEPLMLVLRSHCPLVIDADRCAAAEHLMAVSDVDIIISDDGLQHYALARDIEIALVDSERGLGNGHCLPVGPLREPEQRLQEVDFIINNGKGSKQYSDICMKLSNSAFVSIDGKQRIKIEDWQHKSVHALAGIGSPQRFFNSLKAINDMQLVEHVFPDHYAYQTNDLNFSEQLPIVMTEKDGVKINQLNTKISAWYLEVDAELPDNFRQALLEKITTIASQVGK